MEATIDPDLILIGSPDRCALRFALEDQFAVLHLNDPVK